MQASILPLLWNIQPDIKNLQSFITCQFNHQEELSKIKISGGGGAQGKKLAQN